MNKEEVREGEYILKVRQTWNDFGHKEMIFQQRSPEKYKTS